MCGSHFNSCRRASKLFAASAYLTDAKRARIVALTLKAPPKGLSQWSTREMAAQADVSATTVHRLCRAHALQPHHTQTFKFTTDPDAEAKIHDVVGLYLAPPRNAVVLSVGEKTQIQALERTQPLLPLRPHLPARQTHDYRRHGPRRPRTSSRRPSAVNMTSRTAH